MSMASSSRGVAVDGVAAAVLLRPPFFLGGMAADGPKSAQWMSMCMWSRLSSDIGLSDDVPNSCEVVELLWLMFGRKLKFGNRSSDDSAISMAIKVTAGSLVRGNCF